MGLKAKKLLGHEKAVGLDQCDERKAQRIIIHKRVESWTVLMLKTRLNTMVSPFLQKGGC